jgi:hypothetical protein
LKTAGPGKRKHISPGVCLGVVEDNELVVVSVTVELGPDGVLKSGKNEKLKSLECFLSKSFHSNG